MTYMLCRNRVADFSQWKSVFDSNSGVAEDAGLRLVKIWRALRSPTISSSCSR